MCSINYLDQLVPLPAGLDSVCMLDYVDEKGLYLINEETNEEQSITCSFISNIKYNYKFINVLTFPSFNYKDENNNTWVALIIKYHDKCIALQSVFICLETGEIKIKNWSKKYTSTDIFLIYQQENKLNIFSENKGWENYNCKNILNK